ncbi:MAG: GGDEF domain-containing protein [Betaproteobacteria bacterium]
MRLLFLLLVALLLARLRDMLIRERGLSRTDLATGLPNARAFRETFEGEIARAQRYAQPLSLAFVDIDDFKRVNDSRGHVEGDRLLRRFGQAIRAQLRGSDTVARYGGDEFVILLTAADQNAARAAVDKLRRALSEEMTKESWAADFSIGVVTVQPGGPGASVDALLERADELMYEAKFSGKRGARFAIHGR